jgi:hypothetical protein
MKTSIARALLAAAATCALCACTTTDLSDIPIGGADRACARECTGQYSSCVSGGGQIGLRTETLGACKEALRLCVRTCPTASK